MRLMKGGSLADSLRENGAWEPSDAARLVVQIASALEAAHKQGVVQRDLKPANILLDEDGNAYLSDFGIAKEMGAEAGVTQTGAIVGTPAYLTPEQVQSQPVSAQTDIYALGVVLYELLVGGHPFPDIPIGELMIKHVSEPLPLVRDSRPDLPTELDQVIQKATLKDPSTRYPDAVSLAADFRRALLLEVVLTEIPEGELYNPYKGLRAFREADADDFYGRESLTDQLLARIAEVGKSNRFLAVVGPSGSGKSSVVKAGLIPALRKGALKGSDQWFIVDMIPKAHPLEELDINLSRISANPNVNVAGQLARDERGLLRASRMVLPASEGELLLVIDQFEETFTLVEDKAESKHFMDLIYTAVTDPHSQVRVIITLRADFYDRPLMHPNFSQLIQARTEVVVPLTPEELQRTIRTPAERVGAVLEKGLVPAIVVDVTDQPGALPLLQYALTELFERRAGRMLSTESYQSIGGVLGSLGRKAEEVYNDFDLEGKQATRQLFLRLVTLGEGVEDSRRRVLRSEIESLFSNHQSAISHVFDVFGNARLLTFGNDPLTRMPTVELAHEALLREWSHLRVWLDESRTDIRTQRVLGNAAADWLEADRDQSFLLRGSRLDQLEAWADTSDLALTQVELAYLDASLEERQVRQAGETERHRQAKWNHSLELAAQSKIALQARNRDLALALALSAIQIEDPPGQAQMALSEAAYAPGTIRRFAGHEGAVWATALSPDGHTALSAGDHTVRLWDLQTGEEIRRLELGGDIPQWAEVGFNLEDSQAVVGLNDNSLILLDLETGETIQRMTGHTGVVWHAAISPDGLTALSSSFENDPTGDPDFSMRLWDLGTGKEIRRFEGHSDFVTSIAFAPDGRTALSGSYDENLILWDLVTGDIIHRMLADGGVYTVVISPDGCTALSNAAVNVLLWDLETGEEIQRLEGHNSGVVSFAFSPDGQLGLSGDLNGEVRVWDLETGEELERFNDHNGASAHMVFSADGHTFISSSVDTTLRLWSLNNGAEVRRFSDHESGIRDVAFSPDGRTAISVEIWAVHLWDLEKGSEIRRIELPARGGEVAFTPDGSTALVTLFEDGGVIQLDIATGQQIQRLGSEGEFSEHPGKVSAIAVSPDGKTALSGALGTATGEAYEQRTLTLWDLESGEVSLRIQTGAVFSVDISPDGWTALSGGGGNLITLWDLATGEAIRRFKGHTNLVWDVAYSPDGKTALSGSWDTSLIRWDLESGEIIHRFLGHSDIVRGIAISHDGRTAVSGSRDSTLILWDLATGEALRRYRGHSGMVNSVAFSPDGRSVLSGAEDGLMIQWRIDDTLEELTSWTQKNRYLAEMTRSERAQYGVEPLCEE